MALSVEEKAKLKKHSADQLVSKLRKNVFNTEERIEALQILKLRNKDVSEFDGSGDLLPEQPIQDVKDLDIDSLIDAIAIENNPEKNLLLGELVGDVDDFSSLSKEIVEEIREVVAGTHPKLNVPTKKVPEKKEKSEKKEKLNSTKKKKEKPSPGTKAESIYNALSTTDHSLYKIAQDNETHYSVVKGVMVRYEIVRPETKAIEEDKIE